MFSIFKKSKNTFQPASPDLASLIAATGPLENLPLSTMAGKPLNAEPLIQPELLPDDMPYRPYAWITDEGLLRDEGILFGLSGGKIDEKTEAIEHFFAGKIIQARQEIDFLDLKIDEASTKLGKNLQEETAAKTRLQEINSFKPVDVQYVFWDAISFLGFCAVLVCNYFLIYQVGSKAWEFPVAVATGTYLFGLLTLFNKVSILFSSESSTSEGTSNVERWKLVGQEIGVPLVVALYVSTSGWIYNRPELTIASGVLIFFLFLYAGKALLRQVGFLRSVLNYLINSGNAQKWKKEQVKQLESICSNLTDKNNLIGENIKELREQKQLIRTPDQIEKDRDTCLKLFESEYKLAAESRKVTAFNNLEQITNLN